MEVVQVDERKKEHELHELYQLHEKAIPPQINADVFTTKAFAELVSVLISHQS